MAVDALSPPTVRALRLRPAGRRGLGPAAVLVMLAWSAVPIVLLAYHTIRHGGVLSGSNGPLAGADQLFYMDSIRQSAQHLLITDHFDLVIGHAVFLNPLYLLGGLLWLIGLPLQAAFWLLNLVAAPALALGAVALASSALGSLRARAAAVAVGLFYFSPVLPLLAWTGSIGPLTRYELLLPTGESMPAWQLWGYPHAGVALGAMTAAVLGAVRLAAGGSAREGDTEKVLIAGVSVAAAIVSWLHPWQGAVLLIVLVILGLERRSVRVAGELALPVLAGMAPLVYEAILTHSDSAWHVDSVQNAVGHGPLWTLVAAVLPLALPALLGIGALKPGPLRTALIVWPVAALAVYFGTSQFPYHALQGISIPLAILAVARWRGVAGTRPQAAGAREKVSGRRPNASGTRPFVAAALVLALLTIPGAIYEIKTFRDSERSSAAPYWFTAGERAALAYLDHAKTPGGVLARAYLGSAVPAFTGRRTWVGEWTWTPDYSKRATAAQELMSSRLSAPRARAFVALTGARYALTDCGAPAPLDRLLGPLVLSKRTFGCATVYELRR